MQGTVKWFNNRKGYGFIAPDDGREDLFLHHKQIQTEGTTVQDGQRVEFDVGVGEKGPKALKVKII